MAETYSLPLYMHQLLDGFRRWLDGAPWFYAEFEALFNNAAFTIGQRKGKRIVAKWADGGSRDVSIKVLGPFISPVLRGTRLREIRLRGYKP